MLFPCYRKKNDAPSTTLLGVGKKPQTNLHGERRTQKILDLSEEQLEDTCVIDNASTREVSNATMEYPFDECACKYGSKISALYYRFLKSGFLRSQPRSIKCKETCPHQEKNIWFGKL